MTVEIRSDRPGVGRATSEAVATAVSASFINGESVVEGPVAEGPNEAAGAADVLEAGATLAEVEAKA